MEKLIYLLWKNDAQSRSDFSQHLLRELPRQLPSPGLHGLQLNLVDEAIRSAEHMLIENQRPRFYAMVALWLDSSLNRKPLESALAALSQQMAGYLVSESCPLPNQRHPPTPGRRGYGFNQVVLLRRPPRLPLEEWIAIWQESHTQIAINTQATFAYRQNLVVRPVTSDAPDYQGIVEECFPPQAMTSWQSFYDADDNDALFMRNSKTMVQSCRRFIDLDTIEACATSEYLLQAPPWTPLAAAPG